MGQSQPLFQFIFVLSTRYNLNSNLNLKSIDGVLGNQTRGGRMEGANESTELQRHPHKLIVAKGFKKLPKVQKSPNLVTLVSECIVQLEWLLNVQTYFTLQIKTLLPNVSARSVTISSGANGWFLMPFWWAKMTVQMMIFAGVVFTSSSSHQRDKVNATSIR